MRKASAVVLVFLVTVLIGLPSVSAATLPGFPMKVWVGVTGPFAGNGNIYIFTAAGDWCGTATLTLVGMAVNPSTLAWETARDIIVTAPPLNGGVWYTSVPQPQGNFCDTPVISPLTTYYIE